MTHAAPRQQRTKQVGNGQGSVYQRAGRDGWFASVTHDGRRKVLHAKTKTEVAQLLADARSKRQNGELIMAPSQALEAYLATWLDQVVRPKVRPGTYRGYEQLVRVHLVPGLGRVRVDRLAPAQVQALLNAKLEAGLSPRTVQYMLAVLRSALGVAVRWRLIGRNVAEDVDGPKVDPEEIRPFTADQARSLLEAARGDRLEALYTVAIAMALRQGEALGLQWDDVDLESGELHVRHQLLRVDRHLQLRPLKTRKATRTLAMPAVVVDAVRQHRQRQISAGIMPAGFVFTAGNGSPLDARNVVRSYKALLKAAGLPDRRFHDLRHSAATLLLAQGAAPKVVQAVLGHSQFQVTANTYLHVDRELHKDAAGRMDAVFSRG